MIYKTWILNLSIGLLSFSSLAQRSIEDIDSIYYMGQQMVLRDPKAGLDLAGQIRVLSDEYNYEEGFLLQQSLIAFSHFQLNQLDSSVFILLEIIPQLEKSFPNSYYLGFANNYLGRIYTRLNSLSKAETSFLKASEIFKQIDSINFYCMSLNNYGTIKGMKGDHAEALSSFLEVVKFSQTNTIATNFISSAISNISYIYELEGQNEKAIEYAFEGLKIDQKTNHTRAIADSYNLIGTLYLNDDKIDSALDYYQRVLRLNKANDSQLLPAKRRAMENIAKTHATLGKPEVSIQWLKRAIAMRAEGEDYMSETVAHQLADYYWQLDQSDSALHFARRSLLISQGEGIRQGTLKAAQLLMDVFLSAKQYDSAFHYQSLYHAYKDSIYNESSDKRLTNLRIELETLEKQRQIDELKQREVVAALNDQRLFGGIALAALMLLVLFLIYRHKLKGKQHDLKMKIAKSSQRLSTHTLNMVHKNNGFIEIEEEIRKMKKSGEPNYQKLLNVIQRNKAEERDWENFSEYFGQVHQGFDRRFHTKFPNLSMGENRLATLVKMNLSNPEIASILVIEPKSVSMYKYRLKKKLGLAEDESLHQFLNTI